MPYPFPDKEKKLPLSGWSALGPFLVSVLVVVPVLVVVVAPLTLASVLVSKAGKMIKGKAAKKPPPNFAALYSAEDIAAAKGSRATPVPQAEREYDLVLFGATGFTGRLAALYLTKQYGNSIKWAIAGRRRDALEQLRSELAGIKGELSSLPVLVADVSDCAAMAAIVKSTRVVITTVGPFAKYGSPLVQLCASLGTNYCDITGESDWVRSMIDQFDDEARKTGARIVSFCGHDCVPWDLAVLSLAQELRKNGGEQLKEVQCFDEIRGGPSGGTLETIFISLEHRQQVASSLGFDPMVKALDGSRGLSKTTAANQAMLGYSARFKAWVGPFVMAMVMANCVRRSNALNGYGSNLLYKEAVVFPGFMAGTVYMVQMLSFAAALFCPPVQYLLRKFVLPKPGEGPSVAAMDKGFLQLTAFGTGDRGSKLRVSMYFPTDPGYRDTARMLVESGLVLALTGDRVRVRGGVLTPAACQAELLLDRLRATGTIFSIEPVA